MKQGSFLRRACAHIALSLLSAFVVLCVLFLAVALAGGFTYGIPREVRFAKEMASCFSLYESQHQGRLPTSWEHIAEVRTGSPLEVTYRDISPRKRYAFLPQPLPLLPPHEGELVMVTRRPFREFRLSWGLFTSQLREPGRYLIYRMPGGGFASQYVSEEYVQALFRGHESLLPVPDAEPMRASEEQSERLELRNRALGIALLLLCFIFGPRLCRRIASALRRAAPVAAEKAACL